MTGARPGVAAEARDDAVAEPRIESRADLVAQTLTEPPPGEVAQPRADFVAGTRLGHEAQTPSGASPGAGAQPPASARPDAAADLVAGTGQGAAADSPVGTRRGAAAETPAEGSIKTRADLVGRASGGAWAEAVADAVVETEAAPADVPEAESDAPEDDPIAVVGMGMAVPGASSPEEFWRLLIDGAELFVDAPADRWDIARFHATDRGAPDKTYQRRSGFITDFRPHEKLRAEGLAEAGLDQTALWLRHSLHQALDGVRRNAQDRFSFCVGYTPDGSQHLEEAFVLRSSLDTLAEDGDDAVDGPIGDALRRRFSRGDDPSASYLPHRIGQDAMAGILPPATRVHMVDTACSSSLYAMDLGVRDLLSGRSDIAVCGGSFALAPSGSILFAKLNGLSAGGAVRALDSRRGRCAVLRRCRSRGAQAALARPRRRRPGARHRLGDRAFGRRPRQGDLRSRPRRSGARHRAGLRPQRARPGRRGLDRRACHRHPGGRRGGVHEPRPAVRRCPQDLGDLQQVAGGALRLGHAAWSRSSTPCSPCGTARSPRSTASSGCRTLWPTRRTGSRCRSSRCPGPPVRRVPGAPRSPASVSAAPTLT